MTSGNLPFAPLHRIVVINSDGSIGAPLPFGYVLEQGHRQATGETTTRGAEADA